MRACVLFFLRLSGYWLLIFCLQVFSSTAQTVGKTPGGASLDQQFKNPGKSASPWVFWYWMNGAVTAEGITADLEAMKQAGIGGAYLMPIKDTLTPPLITPAVRQLSPEWWNMVSHAMKDAKRLGIEIGMHVSDGFALAGGPWITPAMSMQKIVWSTKQVAAGTNDIVLEQPETIESYYEDIAVYAYPTQEGTVASTRTTKPIITGSKPDSALQQLADPANTRTYNADDKGWIQYAFDRPFTCRTIIIRSRNNYQVNRMLIEVSDDGINYRSLGRLDPPRHGWQDWDANYTHSIPAVTARFFRFTYDKTGSEPGSEDLDAAKWKPSFKLTGIELSAEPRIHQYEGKNGEVWRVSKRSTDRELPAALCLPLNKIVNLTGKMDKSGRLNWTLPAGKWTILRIGHTSTGHRNDTGGGGKGLECDKFDERAIRTQFNGWYGQVFEKVPADLTAAVLKVFHVDSWECGSQNWSPVFRDAFQKRRGYDLLPYLPVLTGLPIESAAFSEGVLYDVRRTIAELVAENFYVTLAKLAREKGVTFTAESVAPTMVSDGMLHYKHVDIPMGEFWLRSPTHDKPNDMMDAISGAHIYGKNIIQAEAFTELRMSWDEHPGMLKTIADRNYALGINKLVYHVFTHNPWLNRKPGMTLDAIGLYIQRDQTWWKQAKAWVDYAKRCQALLQFGRPAADVAVFSGEEYPLRSVLPDRLVAALPGIFGKGTVEKEQERLANRGEPLRTLPQGVVHSANMADPENWIDPMRGYAYDSYNPDVLLNHTRVTNGRIISTGGSYGVLVLPGITRLNPNGSVMSVPIANKLLKMLNDGANIIINHSPDMIAGAKDLPAGDQPLKTIAELMQQAGAGGKNVGKGKLFAGVFNQADFSAMGIAKDFIATQADTIVTGLAWTHRFAPGVDIYFISNQDSVSKLVNLSLRVSGRKPEIFDPVSGDIYEAGSWKIANGRTSLPVKLEANGSLFVVFREPVKALSSVNKNNWPQSSVAQVINGSWKVKFDAGLGGPAQQVVFDQLSDWSKHNDPAIRNYSGTATYHNTFNANISASRTWLNVGKVANIADVYVNNIFCGTAWTPPFKVDITKALKKGINTVRIDVVNTWANRLMGDHDLPENKRVTQTESPYRLEGKPLLEAGLFGPVQLEISR
ncbi:DNA-binding protein [Segetibacter sp. 3557_3]|uniref:glycosyl hydrolase n=1 Tax=Segetibacter sp. 3557_3 TaxID=2547429 RepID=UPI001058E86A|nr:glycosyl hydrolase [Segetibacter sp. 3557_3]TDH27499.1 DNA-binding protein [Segetibacter sp. 3557_3]